MFFFKYDIWAGPMPQQPPTNWTPSPSFHELTNFQYPSGGKSSLIAWGSVELAIVQFGSTAVSLFAYAPRKIFEVLEHCSEEVAPGGWCKYWCILEHAFTSSKARVMDSGSQQLNSIPITVIWRFNVECVRKSLRDKRKKLPNRSTYIPPFSLQNSWPYFQ